MNKNSKNIVVGVVVIIVIAVIIWLVGREKTSVTPAGNQNQPVETGTPSVPVSETTKVSGSLSKYQNA
ncbi:MAG: hypothetical protein NT077_01775, partial [Candidatus Taylorbacteria bacterium]|nr:hypothetical protein [Candidatus Taylorbacteria bacterium]